MSLNKRLKKNNYILCIETTGKICGIAIFCNNELLFEKNVCNGFTHSVTLFDLIDKSLKTNKLFIDDISLIKVSAGPGSFTGIRIGIACALGLSTNHNIKIEYDNTLESLSYNVKKKTDYIISMIDAKANRVYLSLYDYKNKKTIVNNVIIDIDILINMLNKYFLNKSINFTFVGDGAISYNNLLKEKLKIKYQYSNNLYQKASSLYYVKGKISNFPIINYIQASKAERERYGKN